MQIKSLTNFGVTYSGFGNLCSQGYIKISIFLIFKLVGGVQ